MIIGGEQPKRLPAKAAHTFVALLLATLKNEHANRAGVRPHDQISLLAQRAGQARPDTGVGHGLCEEIAEERGVHSVDRERSRISRFRQEQVRKVPGKNTCRKGLIPSKNTCRNDLEKGLKVFLAEL